MPVTKRGLSRCSGLLCATALASLSFTANAQTAAPNEWTWMGGSQTGDQNPNYGTQGVPSASNSPGFRSKPAVWVDQKGVVWMFSGGEYLWDAADGFWVNQSGDPNDLWQFNPTTSEWTFLAGNYNLVQQGCTAGCPPPAVYGTLGTPAPGNIPGGRSTTASWIDSQGNFWLFGSELPLQAGMDDLWEFNPTSMEWAWMGGNNTPALGTPWKGIYGTLGQFAATNIPGSRYGAVSWTDLAGNFWLFGGNGIDGSGNWADLNDLWEYDPVKGQWRWMAGNSSGKYLVGGWGSPGVYGTHGIPDPQNTPGGRESAVGWRDQAGNLWLFGGFGFDSASNSNYLNDLWKFDISAKAWAWMGGVTTIPCAPAAFACEQPGNYGTLGVETPDNLPPGRKGTTAWVDSNGNAWLFGGLGHPGPVLTWNIATFNELWMFDTANLQWKWMGGYNFPSNRCYSGPPGVTVPTYCAGVEGSFGIQGIPDPGNYPGGRDNAVSWTGTDGSLWLYSGYNENDWAAPGFPAPKPMYSDLWKFQPSDSTLPPAITPLLSEPSGTYSAGGLLTITNGMSNSNIYYTTDGSLPTATSNLYTAPIQITTSQTIKAIAIAPGYPDSGIASATYNVLPPAAAPTFSVAGGTYTSAQTVTISDATPGASMLYATDGSMGWSSYSRPVTVSSTETVYAIAIANGYGWSPIASAAYTINLPPTFTFGPSVTTLPLSRGSSDHTALTITPVNGFNSTITFACSGLPAGTSCSFSPASVAPAQPTTVTVTITSAAATSALQSEHSGSLVFALMLGIGLSVLRMRRRYRTWLPLIVLFGCLGLLDACGGGSGKDSGPPPPVSATVTVTATSGSIQQTATILLTVY